MASLGGRLRHHWREITLAATGADPDDRGRIGANEPGAPTTRSPTDSPKLAHGTSPLKVDLDNNTAVFRGEKHALTPAAAEILDCIQKADGGWVGPKELQRLPSKPTRPDRVISNMPEVIRNLIEARAGLGRRLVLPLEE